MPEQPEWVTLTEGESVVWESRPAVYPYLWGAAKTLAVSAVGVVLLLLAEGVVEVGVTLPAEVTLVVVGGVLVVLGVVSAGSTLIRWSSIRYLVTTEEVYEKRGILSRTVTNLRVERIQNTTFGQSVLGRMLSYGHVAIDTAGGGGAEMVFEYVPDPETVVARITEQVDEQFEDSTAPEQG